MHARRSRLLLLTVVAACSKQAAPAPAVPVEETPVRTCTQAAVGIERNTHDVRAPESSVMLAMKTRCTEDGWSPAVIDCFATMTEGQFPTCARQLAKPARDRLFTTLGASGDDRAAIAIARARLADLKVGVPECERFVTTVANVLGCEGLALDVRVQLGNETAEFWSLPTSGLSADAQQRMATVCSQSLAALQQRASEAGCMP
jgi:hypothetical protein